MEEITLSIVGKMVEEDPWVQQGILLMPIINLPCNVSSGLEESIETAELDIVNPDYKNSAALHGFLAFAYNGLPTELSDEIKLSIERQKLEKEGMGYLGQFLEDKTRTLGKMIASLPRKGTGLKENISAAFDYIHLANVIAYLRFNNSERADMHMHKSSALSKSSALISATPTVFKHFIGPMARAYMALDILKRLSQSDYTTNNLRQDTFHILNEMWNPGKA